MSNLNTIKGEKKRIKENITHFIIIRDSNVILRNKKYVLWLQVRMNEREVMHDCTEMPKSLESRITRKI